MKALAGFLKRLAIALIALSGIGLALLLLLLVILDDDDYKSASIALIERVTASRLTIAGDFELTLSTRPALTMTHMSLASNSGNYRVRAGRIAIRLRLLRLWSGLLWFENLELHDVIISVNAQAEATGIRMGTPGTIIPVFEKVLVTHLVVEDRRRDGQQAVPFSVTRLSIEQPGQADRLQVSGAGTWDGAAVELTGDLGPAKDLLGPPAPYPVNIKLLTPDAYLTASGTLGDPSAFADVDLELELQAKEFSGLLIHWRRDLPDVGAIEARATLVGSAKALRLTDIEAALERPEVMRLQLSGEMGIGQFPKGTHLTFSADLADPGFLGHLLPSSWPTPSAASLEGRLQDENGRLRLKLKNSTVQSKDGLHLAMQGTGTLNPGDSDLPFRDLNATVDFSAPSAEAARPLLPKGLPKIGPVNGHFRLASDAGTLSIEDIEVQGGKLDSAQVRVTGRLGRLPLAEDGKPSGFDLDIAVHAKNTAALARSLGTGLPEFGAIEASARLVGETAALSLDDIDIRAGASTATQLRIRGTAGLGPPGRRTELRYGRLDAILTASSSARLGALFDKELPDIGPVNGRLRYSIEEQRSSAPILQLEAGREDGVYLQAEGAIEQLHVLPEVRMAGMQLSLNARAASTRSLAPLVGRPLPEFGPIRGSARLTQGQKTFALRDIEVSAGSKGAPLWTADGHIGDLLQLEGIGVQIHADTPTGEMLKAWTGASFPGLGRFQGQLTISGSADGLSIPTLSLESGLDGIYRFKLRGSIARIGKSNRFDLTHKVNLMDPVEFARLLDMDTPWHQPVAAHGRLLGSQGAERLSANIRTGESEAKMELSAGGGEARTGIKGQITIPVLHLADLPFARRKAPQEKPPAHHDLVKPTPSGPLFSPAPFDLGGLQGIDTELEILVDKVVGTGAAIEGVTGRVTLQQGQLRVSPLEFTVEGGKTSIDFALDARAIPQGRLQLHMQDVPLSALLENAGISTPISGALGLDADLRGQGQSAHEIASNLNGRLSAMVENGRIPGHYFDLASADVPGWVISKTAPSQERIRLDCAMVSFSVDQGVATSDTLIIDGSDATMTGAVTLDLGLEIIDLKVYPQRKTQLWRRLDPIRLTGSLSDPEVSALSKTEITRTYGTLLLLPQVYAGEKALGYLSGLLDRGSRNVDSPCQKLGQRRRQAPD